MKILIAPDKFKSTLTATEVGQAIEEGIKRADKNIETIMKPIADGGEGTLEVIEKARGGQKITVVVQGPLSKKTKGYFLKTDSTVFIEMSLASGLSLIKESERNPLHTSTFGTGELIKAALEEGCQKIVVTIGGSATTDGGLGAAKALGAKFFDKFGRELSPVGKNLIDVKDIDLSNLDKKITSTEILVACDVMNPFYGNNGAAKVYAPQKGASPQETEELDRGLVNLAKVVKEKLGIDLQKIRGSGAAGGLGGGLVCFLKAKIISGIDLILQTINLEEKIIDADLVFTGEGKIDAQTAFGKAPMGVARLAKKHNKPVYAICGQVGKGWQEVLKEGISKVYPIATTEEEINQALKNPSPLIKKTVQKIIESLI